MSSILKALKRIEKDAPPQDESHPWPRPIDSKKAFNSRVKKTWLYNKLLRLLVIFIILGAVGWLVISQREVIVAKLMPAKSRNDTRQQSAPSQDQSRAYQAKISSTSKPVKNDSPHTSKAPAKPAAKSNSPKKLIPAGSNKPSPRVLSQTRAGQPPSPPIPPPVKNKQSLKTKSKSGQLNRQTGSTVSQMPATMPITSTGTPDPKGKAGGSNTKFDSVSVFNDSKLKLQAIAWSQDASRRMVVINSRIFREGETVDGFSITQIREDDVIITDGSEIWRLEFSLKQ